MPFDAGAIVGRLTLQGLGEFDVAMQRVKQSVKGAEQASRGVPPALNAIRASSQAVQSAAQGTARQILQMAAAFGIATTAAQAVGQAQNFVRDQFTKGLDAVEDFRATTVEIAASLTSLAKDPSPRAFAQNMQFASNAMIKLDIAAAKFLATGEQLRLAFQAFAQRGIVPVTDRDFDALGRITDAIVILTKGQGVTRQLFQEINDLITGRVVPGMSRVAGFIEAQVGDLKQWVELHRAAGDLIPAIAQKLEGFRLAQGEILDLSSTWKNTLETVFEFVRRRAFAKPYEDIRDALKAITFSLFEVDKKTGEFTGKLTPLAEDIIRKVNDAWTEFKETAVSTFEWLRTHGPGILEGLKASFESIGQVLDLTVVPALKLIQSTLEQIGRGQLFAKTIREATELGFQTPPGVALGGEEQFRAAQEFIERRTRELNEQFKRDFGARPSIPELGIPGRLVPQDEVVGPDPMRPPAVNQEAMAKVEAGLRAMHERIAKLRGDAFQAEIEEVRAHADKLLELAKGDMQKQAQIVQARERLIGEITLDHHKKLVEENRKRAQDLLDAENDAQVATLEAQGRHHEAQFAALKRSLDKELAEVELSGAKRAAILQRGAAEAQKIATAARESILNIDRSLFDERRKLATDLLDLEERIAAIRVGTLNRLKDLQIAALGRTRAGMSDQSFADAVRKIEEDTRARIKRVQDELRRMREQAVRDQTDILERMKATLDPVFDLDRIRSLNQDLTQLAQQTARDRSEALLREAEDAATRGQELEEKGQLQQADLARRRARDLEDAAIAAIAEGQTKTRALVTENLKLLQDQRDKQMGVFKEVFKTLTGISGTAVKEIGDHFTALSNHIVKSVSDAVREAAAQIASLTGRKFTLPQPGAIGGFTLPAIPGAPGAPPAPPEKSPALPKSGIGFIRTESGRGIIVQGNQIINIEKLPDWIQTPEQARDFILQMVDREIQRVTRSAAQNPALF